MSITINILSIYSAVSLVVHVLGVANAGHAIMNVRSSRGAIAWGISSTLKQNFETNSSAIATLSHWFTHVILWEVGVAIIFGAFLGYAAGRILEWAERKKTIERQSFLGYTIALSITVLGAAKLN